MLSNEELSATLSITLSNSCTSTAITGIEPTESLENLGVWMSPSGFNNIQFKILSNSHFKITTNIKAATITTCQAGLIVSIYLHTEVQYIFSATAFCKKECEVLDRIF